MGLKDLESQVNEEKSEIEATESKTKFSDFFKPLDKIDEGEGAKILMFGPPESGKSYFGLSCPGPIVAISTEFGIKKVAHHFKDDKQIVLKECNVPYGGKIVSRKGEIDKTPFRVDPMASLQKVEEAAELIKEALDSGELKKGGTIIIDSITDIWSWLSTYLDYSADKKVGTTGSYVQGKDWTKINEAFRTLVNKFNILPMHVVLTARAKHVTDRDGNKTGPDTFKAAKEANHFVDLVLHSDKVPVPTPGQAGKYSFSRVTTIEKCRQQSMNNLQLVDCTYDTLKEAFVKVGAGHVFDIKA